MSEKAKIFTHREAADEWSVDFIRALGAWCEEIERPGSKPISQKPDPFRRAASSSADVNSAPHEQRSRHRS
jgi:hypothetical protein